jgi:hypothetical protein
MISQIILSGDAFGAGETFLCRINQNTSPQNLLEKMKKIVWTYGLISGGILSLMMAVTAAMGTMCGEYGAVIGYTTMLLAGTLIFFGIRGYRDRVGYISFGRALGIGLLITLVSSIMYVIAWTLIYNFMIPDFIDQWMGRQIQDMRASGASEQQILEARKEFGNIAELYQNPLLFVLFTFIEPLPVAILISLVSALILKRKPISGGPTVQTA